MNRLTPAALVSAALLLPLNGAMAQTEMRKGPAAPQNAPAADKDAVDPAAKDFIEKFRAVVKKVDDISCTVTQTMDSGDSKESNTGELVAVLDRKGARANLKMFRIASKHDTVDAVWAFDGKSAYKIDRAAKTFASMVAPDGMVFPVQDVAMVIPTWVYGSDVLSSKDAKLVAAKFLPEAQADGVSCKVVQYTVEVVYPEPMGEDDADAKKHEPVKMTMSQTRFVGSEDLIPRKIESRTVYTGGAEEPPAPRTFTAAYTNVKVNTRPKAEVFTLKAPDGFTTAKADASDLGIPSDDEPKLKFAAGDAAPAFALKNPEGTEVTLASLKGKVVLLDFWATWCPPCKKAMPGLQKLHEKYKDKGVVILGIDTFERGASEKARKYMADNKYTYGLLYDGDDLAKTYGISGIPTFVLIGADGKIIHLGVGFDADMEEHLAQMIDKAIAGK